MNVAARLWFPWHAKPDKRCRVRLVARRQAVEMPMSVLGDGTRKGMLSLLLPVAKFSAALLRGMALGSGEAGGQLRSLQRDSSLCDNTLIV